MKKLAVIFTLMITLLVTTLSLPTAHAMSMNDAASVSSSSAMTHDCCDEQASQSLQQDWRGQ